MGLEKFSNEKVAQVLVEAASTIRELAAERDKLAAELDGRNRRDDAMKVAHAVVQKGLSSESVEKLAQNFEQMAKQGKLQRVKDAVDFIVPDMGAKLAQVATDDRMAQGGSSSLESFLMGGS